MSANKAVSLIIAGSFVVAAGIITAAVMGKRSVSKQDTTRSQRIDVVAMPTPSPVAVVANTDYVIGDKDWDVPVWERSWDYWIALRGDLGLEVVNEEGEFYMAASPGNAGIRVIFKEGRLDEVFVSRTDMPGLEGAESVFEVWDEIDPHYVPRFRRLRSAGGRIGHMWHRVDESEYAYAWAEYNKAILQWVGSPEQHEEAIEMGQDIRAFVRCWDDYVEAKRGEMLRLFEANDPSMIERSREIFDELAAEFDQVKVADIEMAECWSGRSMQTMIPDRWPECSKTKLLVLAGRCKDICRRGARIMGKAGSEDERPFGDLAMAFAEDGIRATDCHFDRMSYLSDHEDLAVLPSDMEEWTVDLFAKAMGALAERNKASSQ